MTLWILMCTTASLIPLIMIISGGCFSRKAPKKINNLFGYRTALSMKNEDTWKFAHKHMGKLWFRSGIIMLPVSIAAMFLALGKGENTVYSFATVITLIQTILLVILIFPTEAALRKNFDKDGNRK
ncbi:MAG: SdpI family protein [Clostridia bacterium]|nr:SdpI family protein [Clostridia bacterium]